jgi:hypothetical protein
MRFIAGRERIRGGYLCSTQTAGSELPGEPTVVVPAHVSVATLSAIAANGASKRLIAGCLCLRRPRAIEAWKPRDALEANRTMHAMSADRKKSAGASTRRNS